MKVGDKCKYRAAGDLDVDRGHVPLWKTGVILEIKGPFSAKVYTIVGIDQYAGELTTATSAYVMEAK